MKPVFTAYIQQYSLPCVSCDCLAPLAGDLMYWKDGINRAWPRSQETTLFLLVDEVDKFNDLFKARFLTVFKWDIRSFNGRDFVPKEKKSLSAQLALTLKNMKAAPKKKHNSDSEEGKRDKEKAEEWAQSIPGMEYLGRTRVNFKLSHVWAYARDDGDDKQTAYGQPRIRTRPEDGGENQHEPR